MDTQKNIDEHMLLDYFSGSLSATQKQEVEEWLNLVSLEFNTL